MAIREILLLGNPRLYEISVDLKSFDAGLIQKGSGLERNIPGPERRLI